MSFRFLKPGILNLLLTLTILFLPIFRESATLPGGGQSVDFYQPIILFFVYIKLKEWYALYLISLFFLFIYFLSSITISIGIKFFNIKSKFS